MSSWQDFFKSFWGSYSQAELRPTPRLVISAGLNAVYIGLRFASAVKGRDMRYQPGSYPLTPRRQATNALAIVNHCLLLASALRELASRTNDSTTQQDREERKISELVIEIAVNSVVTPLLVRELVTGKTTVNSRALSSVGRTANMVNLAPSLYTAAVSAAELYERREEWLPRVQDTFKDAKHLVDYATRATMNKIRRLACGDDLDYELEADDYTKFMASLPEIDDPDYDDQF